jgi:nucleoside 2-deoxyribosyltransferase
MATRLKAITRAPDHQAPPHEVPTRATRVYIAAPYTFRDEARRVRAMMHANYSPLRSVARWLDRPTLPPCEWTNEVLEMEARECVEDINAADAVLVLHPDESTGGGLLVEIGIAVQRGLPISVVWDNKRRQKPVFFSLPQIHVVTLLNDALDALAAIPPR